MKLKPYILIILLAFGFSACKKQHTVTIQAHSLVNPLDGSHYANKRFVIYEISYKLFGQSKAKAVVDDYFDNNGYANFELKMDKNKDYMLDVEYMDDICYLDLKTDDFLSHASTINVDFNYGACGYINLQRTSINCEGSTDKFRYKYYYSDNPDVYIYTGFVSGSDHHWSDNSYLEGCNDYIGDFSEKRPAGHYTIEWMVERPSGTTYGSDTFVITEGDTTTYVLEY